jgi:hypothetical protein
MTNNYSISYNNKSNNNTNTNISNNINTTTNNTTTMIDNSDSTDTMLGLIKKLERCLICPENLQNPDRGTKLLLRIRILINQDNNSNNNSNNNGIDNSNRVGSSNGISSSRNVGILYKSNIINQLLKNNSSILRNCNLTDEFLRVLLPLLR